MIQYSVKLALTMAVIAGISGCATPPAEMSADFLCINYAYTNQSKSDRFPAIRDEIQRRKLLADSERAAVEQGVMQIGMSRCAMLAVQGYPLAENNTTSAAGSYVQHVFNSPGGRKKVYVYTTNGRVTSWQN